MNTRFIELDSTYRNRNQFSKPSLFEVLISQTGTKDKINSLDPICNSCPQLIFCPQNFVNNVGIIDTNNVANNNSIFIVNYAVNPMYPLSKNPDYLVGATIIDTTNIKRVINESTYLSSSVDGLTDSFIISVSIPFPIVPTSIQFVQSTSLLDTPYFFIQGGAIADNYYEKTIIYNETYSILTTIPQWRSIITYDGTTKIAGINVVNNPLIGWNLTDTYILRSVSPQEIGILQNGSDLTTAVINKTYCSPLSYIGDFIRITTQGANYNKICRIVKCHQHDKCHQNETELQSNCSLSIPLNETKLQLDCSLSIPLNETDTYEILQYTRDNAVPFTYTGSTVSQQSMVCYEIELIDLVLPNKTLKNGGRIAFYPYVYVEFQNISSSSSGNTNIIYSNNPNSTRMLFRCPIDDIPNPLLSPFIKIDSDGAKQIIKFKPNDNLKFGVYLPNGELFETLLPEYYSPCAPNPFIQISALFSIKRL